MRLDFNILWVEDQPANVKSQEIAMDRRIREEGFRLNVHYAESVAEAEKCLSSEIYGDHIDLVLMDFDLGDAPGGDIGISAVRETFPYKDLVFYSAKDAADLSEIVADNRLDGVFCSTRADLPDEVFGLFETLIKKVLDIDHARGIVIGTTSDIDGLVFDCLDLCSAENGSLTESARVVISKQLKYIKKNLERAIAKLSEVVDVDELHDLHLVYSSAHRHKLLRKLLEGSESHKELCKAMIEYADKTVPKRNVLAHVRVKREGFTRKLYNNKDEEITSSAVRDLRLELLSHQEDLERLIESLKTL